MNQLIIDTCVHGNLNGVHAGDPPEKAAEFIRIPRYSTEWSPGYKWMGYSLIGIDYYKNSSDEWISSRIELRFWLLKFRKGRGKVPSKILKKYHKVRPITMSYLLKELESYHLNIVTTYDREFDTYHHTILDSNVKIVSTRKGKEWVVDTLSILEPNFYKGILQNAAKNGTST